MEACSTEAAHNAGQESRHVKGGGKLKSCVDNLRKHVTSLLPHKDQRETSESRLQNPGPSHSDTNNHGIPIEEFKRVERPIEPLCRDQPVRCPLPEPSILNDGRIWKERMSASIRVMTDLSAIEEESDSTSKTGSRNHSTSTMNVMLSSQSRSAPECNITNLLKECGASSTS